MIKNATNWKQLGLNLKIDDNLLNIIERDDPHDCERCYSKMLSEWLKLTPNASWKMLCNAIENIPNEVPSTSEKTSIVMDKLIDTVEELWSSLDIISESRILKAKIQQLNVATRNLSMLIGTYVHTYVECTLQKMNISLILFCM